MYISIFSSSKKAYLESFNTFIYFLLSVYYKDNFKLDLRY